jgi:hypothetical protein
MRDEWGQIAFPEKDSENTEAGAAYIACVSCFWCTGAV